MIEVNTTGAITEPPTALSYSNAVYMEGIGILDNTPSSSGSDVDEYSETPDLTSCLSFNPNTGLISGNPITTATVTVTNSAGSTSTTLTITVNPRVTITTTPVGQLDITRRGASRMLLPNGKVLIAGG